MDASSLTTLISTVGFPIVMCGALFWYITKQTNSHKEEIDGLKEVITKLEYAITNLCNLVGENTKNKME